MTPLMWLLAGLAAARTFRLFAVDGIGKPVRWRFHHAMEKLAGPGSWQATPRHPRRTRLAIMLTDGAFCTACFPYWITLFWVATGLAWSDTWPWQLLAGSLGVSYVASHVLAKLEGPDIDDQ